MTSYGLSPAAEHSAIHRQNLMQFGTRVEADGVLFRLWAPAARKVELALYAHGREGEEPTLRCPLTAQEDGWFQLQTKAAKIGDLYKFVIDDNLAVPDPASRHQPRDVHGPSEIIDPESFAWTDDHWQGKPWETAILYELNVGTFSESGTFRGVEEKLDELVKLGVTAVELMPVADFPGRYGWGYDGVLPFAPESSYGRPEDLKSLVQAAHAKGLMIFLDVVYNHFGPEGNYLHAYAKRFFTEKHKTPWGAAINYDDQGSATVRDFFIQNALYWLTEFNFDGLRLDAVHAIKDDSDRHILKELAQSVAAGPGRERQVHLVLENDDNIASFLKRTNQHHPQFYTAQWNDDVHHAFHVLATGEKNGYYAEYVKESSTFSAIEHLGRCLSEGFSYQGQASQLREGETRGEPSSHLPPTAFVSFIQNHDQVGNRAFGDRIAALVSLEALKAISAVYLLAPSIPMLFMGEEWGSKEPFLYFCDVGEELAPLVTAGRRKEFAKFPEFSTPEIRERIPDPCSDSTFNKSKLNWGEREGGEHAEHAELLKHYMSLIKMRKEEVVPLLSNWTASEFRTAGKGGLRVNWQFGQKGSLILLANLSDQSLAADCAAELVENEMSSLLSSGKVLYQNRPHAEDAQAEILLTEVALPWSVLIIKR